MMLGSYKSRRKNEESSTECVIEQQSRVIIVLVENHTKDIRTAQRFGGHKIAYILPPNYVIKIAALKSRE